MILATYQPLKTTVTDKKFGEWNELEKYLGYSPIFCFPARDQKETIIYSILAAPNCPERLIFFETDEYDALDIIQWNRHLAIQYQKEHGNNDIEDIPIEKCFTNKPDKYKEFLVRKIDNIIAEINIYESFCTNFTLKDENDTIIEDMTKIFNLAQQHGIKQYENLSKASFDQQPDTRIKRIILKDSFQVLLLPFIYNIIFKRNILESIMFDYKHFMYDYISHHVGLFYNTNEPLKHKTYNKYNEMLYEISSCMRESMETIGRRGVIKDKKVPPNAPCPCGSGKKFKKCCGRFI